MALGSFLRENRALGLQQGVVGIAREISGRQASRRAQRTGFRSRREISRRGQRTLRPLFPRGLCRQTGYKGPLHRCSIYNNKEAGARLNKMLEMGQSRPWPEALEVMTGEKQMDATAILDYFAPLKKWLDEQNAKDGAKLDW